MDQPNKKQKVEEMTSYKEAVLFNSDTLSKIISYLPSVDVLNLAITCKRFGISNTKSDEQSLIKKSAHVAVQDIATEEELAALPHYEGESKLADYHYLHLLRKPLTFDQLVGAMYVNTNDKSCVHFHRLTGVGGTWATAFSNNTLRAGKHYASFKLCNYMNYSFFGVMRPGQANENAIGIPLYAKFYQNFYINKRKEERHNNNIQCCMYVTHTSQCISSNWLEPGPYYDGTRSHITEDWEGMETMSLVDEIGMLLDLDEGTLSVYKNGMKLGVMKRGLAGNYCWVASLHRGAQVSIKRGSIPS